MVVAINCVLEMPRAAQIVVNALVAATIAKGLPAAMALLCIASKSWIPATSHDSILDKSTEILACRSRCSNKDFRTSAAVLISRALVGIRSVSRWP